jgi:serine phosphatase RsbU (regulator of sigma subunit)
VEVAPQSTDKPGGTAAEERIAQLTRTLEMTKHLAAEKDLDRLFGMVIHQACSSLACEKATLFLYDEQRRELYSTHTVAPLQGLSQIRLSVEKGIVGLAARERRLVHVPDPYNHPLFHAETDRQTQFRTRNILAAPLVSWSEGKLLGVLQLLNKVNGPFLDADEQLLSVFAAHVAIALERSMLARHYLEKLKLEASLEMSRAIQAGFFPRQFPKLADYEVFGTSRPAEATGGDYFDAIPLPSGRVGLVVADVCGHGLGPSLLMASVRALLRGFVLHEPAPEALLTDLSDALYDDLTAVERHITLVYGVLDPAAHRFDHANAGHGPVVVHLPASGSEVQFLAGDEGTGCPLGFLREQYRACAPVALAPGDLLVLGSDGLIETKRGSELFGMERLTEYLRAGKGRPLPDLVNGLLEATTAFQEIGRPGDDLTLLLVRQK